MADMSALRDRVRSWGIDVATSAAQLVIADMRATAPRDTGDMTDDRHLSITSVEVGGDLVAITVEATAEYASWQEEGTGVYGPRGQRIYPVQAKALVFNWKKMGGRQVAFASVKGSPATKWFSTPLGRWSERVAEAVRTVAT